MRLRVHIRLLLLAIGVWAAFWVGGLPDYYQQYSTLTMIVLSAALVPMTAYAAVKILGRAPIERRRALGFWLALYYTVPFAILDYLYCGVYLGHGWSFAERYWYLTIYYVIPWLLFVPIGILLGRRG